jgi:hypothetical protein
MTQSTKVVAYDVCVDQSLVAPSIDCSLCGLGWPMADGRIRISFWGPVCPTTNQPAPSYWLGIEPREFRWFCLNPGNDAEPNPNTWGAVGYFSGISVGGSANSYKLSATVTVVDKDTVTVNLTVFWLNSAKAWETYFSKSVTLDEVAHPNNPEPWRGRGFVSGYLPVTVSENGGKGDPVSFIKLELGFSAMVSGCGSKSNGVPPCGFWTGSGWHSCLVAHLEEFDEPILWDGTNEADSIQWETPETNPLMVGNNHPGRLIQMGRDPAPCGQLGAGAYCQCDQIVLKATGPHWALKNKDPGFVAEFGTIGVPGEAVGVLQEIQIGGPLVAKAINGGPLYLAWKTQAGTYEVVQPTVAQGSSPNILKATFSKATVWLYSMVFPNPAILPDACSSSLDPAPQPNPGFYCMNGACVWSYTQPAGATGGPFSAIDQCSESCVPVSLMAGPIEESTDPVAPNLETARAEAVRRVTLPCVHLGEPIEDPSACGCGSAVLRRCNLHGECRKTGYPKGSEMICFNCEDWKGGE